MSSVYAGKNELRNFSYKRKIYVSVFLFNSQINLMRTYDWRVKQAKQQHSAVESAINALEVHGLDKCLDHGIDAFERYVGLAVLSRNIQKLGTIKRDMERLRLLEEQQKLAAWRILLIAARLSTGKVRLHFMIGRHNSK